MNFLFFFIIQLLFFLATAPFQGRAQCIYEKENSFPEPLVSVITTLPSGYVAGFNGVVVITEGKLLISGDNQLLLWDGINWEKIASSKKANSINDLQGNVYFTSNKCIEQLIPDSRGSFIRRVLVDSSFFESDQKVTKLALNSNQELFFSTKNMLWRYSNGIIPVDSSQNPIKLFDYQGFLAYAKEGEGIFILKPNDSIPKLLPNTKTFSNKNLIQVFEIDNQPYAVVSKYPWIISLNNQNKQLNLNIEHYFCSIDSRVVKAYYVNNEIYLLSERDGVIILDSNFNLASHIRKEAHNSLEQSIDIIPLSEGSMLVVTKSTILRIFRSNIIGLYSKPNVFSSMINNLIYHDSFLYCATNTSLLAAKYQALKPHSLSFQKVKGINGHIDNLYAYNDILFAAGKAGVFMINNNMSKRIHFHLPQEDFEHFIFTEYDNELWLIVAGDQGLILNSVTKSIDAPLKISYPDHLTQIEYIKTFKDYLFVFLSDGRSYKAKIFPQFQGWSDLLQHEDYSKIFYLPLGENQKPYVSKNGNLYRYNHLNGSLSLPIISDSLCYLTPILETESNLFVKRFISVFPEVYSIWLYHPSKDKEKFFPSQFAASLPAGEIIRQALLLPDSTLMLSTTSGLYYFSNSKILRNAFRSIVSIFWISLESNRHKVIFKDGYIVDESKPIASHKTTVNRNLSLTLASIGCSEWGLVHGKVQFSSFLNGYDSYWTAWSSNHTRDIQKLAPGEYTLCVKARNFLGEESAIESISFTILPKFYQTQLFYVVIALLGLVGFFMVYQWRRYMHAKERYKLESLINKRTEELVKEKEKTENLLARVLPKDTADELKEKGRVNTQRFQVVTVLFCDIEGFTRITDETNPEALIDQLDRFFLYFDSVVEKYRIEKIKTIGDAYMCAGGIPKKNQTNPVEVVLAALEMMQYMKHITTSNRAKSSVWDLRIGIDTGPVIAGVVGRNKLSYDIWGSTVNTASRMESSGESGQINISGNTFMLVKDYFICTFRGKMPVKNKGDIQMYFVNGIKPSLSEGLKGIIPNQDFYIQLQLIRLSDLEDFILEKLEKGLPQNLYYHNLKHTVDVYTQVELIGRSENVTKEELLLLRTAALFHDAGHLIDYDTHEEMAVKLANEILPQYQYADKQISVIAQLIMATKMPPNPTNLLEEIMCDADLDYLGRPDFIPVSNMLYKELHEHGKIGTEREWNEIQIKFINSHFYFTKTARRLRNVNKQSQLEKLKAWMDKN